MEEIENNSQVEVVWCTTRDQSQVRIRGKMAMEEDEAIHQQSKQDNPMVAKTPPQGAEDLFLLYKLEPEVVEVAEGLVPYTVVEW